MWSTIAPPAAGLSRRSRGRQSHRRSHLVVEQAGAGVHTVLTSLSTYTSGNQVENVTFTGGGASTLTGNALHNILQGGAGVDILNGGAGADVLAGDVGTDTFVLRKGEAAADRLNMDMGDQLRFEGFGQGAVLVENGATAASNDWCIPYSGGVEVLEINGRALLIKIVDFVFV